MEEFRGTHLDHGSLFSVVRRPSPGLRSVGFSLIMCENSDSSLETSRARPFCSASSRKIELHHNCKMVACPRPSSIHRR